VLEAVQDHQVVLGDDTPELHALAGIVARHAGEILDEPLLAVGDVRIVLDVLVADVAGDRLARRALIEHQIVERHRVPLVALKLAGHDGVLVVGAGSS
jgi:hypothetical protein